VEDGTWSEASGDLDLSVGETPSFSGRAVAALAALPRDAMLGRSGRVEVVAELADEFGFTEADGSRPYSIRSLRYLLPNFVFPTVEKQAGKPVPAWVRDNVPDVLLPWSVFSGGPPPEPEPEQ
jgi:dehydrogenase/reductase SDR family protein 1